MDNYITQLESLLKRIKIFVDYSFTYKIDEDAGTLKIWIHAGFQGGSRFDGFEFLILSNNSLVKSKYRYNFVIGSRIIRWDNAPHHKSAPTYPHHLHLDSKILDSLEPNLEYVLDYVKKFL